MARTQKLLDIDPETGRVFEDADIGDEENLKADQDKQFDEIVGEFESADDNITYRATINRVPDGYKKGGKEEWCFDVDSAEIAGVRLKMRDEYGPGIYRIRIWKNKKQVRQFDYHIAKPTITRPIAASGDNVAMQALSEQIRTLTENQNRLMERLLNNPKSNDDRFLDLERMSTILKNMQPAVQPVTASNFGMKEGMELFTKGMELAENMRSDGGDTWISVIKEMAKNLPVAELLENLTKAKQQPPMQRRQLAGPQFQPNPIQHQAPPIQNGNVPAGSPAANGEILEQNMRYLIIRAQRNSDPGLYAEWLLDNADPALIRQMANDPNVIQQLSVIFPRLNEPGIRSWFIELVEAVKEILANAPPMEDNGAGIEPQSDETGQHDGSAGAGSQHPGWGGGDQNHPENHAIPGETGSP